ncbi:unnamed protein product [Nippostrongylus brasiliensis]|uniref:Salivary glue protein Sgs-3 (inferred by orthology to a D. melanogaster protein) n=1 Tax=Nippostrongylus brasiliensis TaxID=27835 RepID=A0A0N4XU85_NIPBR|nr:unnamed protein product [Nippostrongylus brasiliensis]
MEEAQTSFDKVSVMSPRLFSLFPETSKSPRRRLLSPTILSFQKEGFFSLPELFNASAFIFVSDRKHQQLLIDMIMDVSGAGGTLQELIAQIKPEMEEVKNVKFPLVERLSKKSAQWKRAHSTLTDEQRSDYDRNGFAFLNADQLALIYDQRGNCPKKGRELREFLLILPFLEYENYGVNLTELGSLSKEQKIERLERDIRSLASMSRPSWPSWAMERTGHRKRREAEGEEHHGVEFLTLQPAAFTHLVGSGAALELVTLSPRAFIDEVDTLSPRAFAASILSPNALIARVLSPTAFRVEVLSPRALHTWVLSPEAFLAEILTPRFLDARVLSPQVLLVEVLSPGILAPHFQSSETAAVLVLSPNILSPRIQSDEKMVIEVLSPHFLGGAHSAEEKGTGVEGGHGDDKHTGDDHHGHGDHHEGEHHGENEWIHFVGFGKQP